MTMSKELFEATFLCTPAAGLHLTFDKIKYKVVKVDNNVVYMEEV